MSALRSYAVMDTPPEEAFDDFTYLISQWLDVPIALISLLDEQRQWFKSKVGLGAEQTPRDWAFCGHAILDSELMVIEDAATDPRFAGNPLVTGDPNLRFYAGCPLITAEGYALGTLCVIDRQPRKLTAAQLDVLRRLGRQLVNLLELRRTTLRQREAERILREQRAELKRLALVAERTHNVVIMADQNGRITWANDAFEKVTGFSLAEAVGRTPGSLMQFEGSSQTQRSILRNAVRERKAARVHILNRGKHGAVYWVDVDLQPLIDDEQGFLGFVAIETDITDLIRQREQLDAMFEALPVGFLQLDADLNIQRSNRLALNIIDSPSAASGVQLPLSIQSRVREVMDGVRGYEQQTVVLSNPSGYDRWLQVSVAPLPGTLGQPDGVLIALADQTEQVQIAHYMELASETAELCLWYWHIPRRQIELSSLWRKRLDPDKSMGSPAALLHPDDRSHAFGELRQLVRNERSSFRFECRIRYGQDDWRWVLCGGAVTQRNSRGKIIALSGILLDIDERKRMEQALETAATTDALTQLPNRIVLKDRLQQALYSSKRHRRLGALLFLDLDHFKRINDSHGHSVGDELLKAVARRVQSQLRLSDTLARMGGDEMLVLLPELADTQDSARDFARAIANKIQGCLDVPLQLNGATLRIGVSIGITLFPKNEVESAEDLIREADTAMYVAKGRSRGKSCLFEPQMHRAVSQRLSLDIDLRHALERSEFYVCIQGKRNGKTELVGGELLLRWLSPARGEVPPNDFIPVAEDSELIVPLGHWVLEEACRIVKKIHAVRADFVLSVNLSPVQIRQPGFASDLRAIVRKAGVKPESLIFEITEGVLLQSELAQQIVALDNEGFRFSIDDFGTGYSSLSYLMRLPVHELKIDRSFVRDIEDDANHAALVQAILSISRRFGIRTVAEGVETQLQAHFLSSSGCDLLQGYFFDKPQPVDEFMAKFIHP